LRIDRANQVWCADITKLPIRNGFRCLVAVMDWDTAGKLDTSMTF
jgi:putative transposase